MSTPEEPLIPPDAEHSAPALSRVRAERRAHLLSSAMQIFLRDGYVGTSMERVAEQAGVSRQTLYNYFADKEELFVALVEARKMGEYLPRLQAALEHVASAGGEAGLRTAVDLLMQSCASAEMAELFQLLIEISTELPEVMEHLRQRIFLRGALEVREALDRGVAAGNLRPLDTAVVAHILFGVASAYGVLSPTIMGEHRPSTERMAAAFADLLAHGIFAR